MSVERKTTGWLRLRCDVEGCPRKFVPLRHYNAPRDVRARAFLFGWSVRERKQLRLGETNPVYEDICPEHSRR